MPSGDGFGIGSDVVLQNSYKIIGGQDFEKTNGGW